MSTRLIASFLLLFSSIAVAHAGDDFQTWHQFSLRPYKSEKLDFILFSDWRFTRNAGKMSLYFISPKLVYHHSKNLDLGLNYTYLQSRSTSPTAVDDSYNLQHRAEVEINPQWQPASWLKVKMRNRVEFRWIEDRGSDNTRYRQRWMLEFPVNDALPLKSIYASSEAFYDFSRGEYAENRTVPIGLNFKLSDKASLSLYHMIQSQKGTADWSSNQILGTLVSVDF